MSTIVKDNKLEIFINDELLSSYPLSEISKEKGFPNTPIHIYFSKRFGNEETPVKIDNLYIGPPRTIKK